jgi:hypothetical protein
MLGAILFQKVDFRVSYFVKTVVHLFRSERLSDVFTKFGKSTSLAPDCA